MAEHVIQHFGQGRGKSGSPPLISMQEGRVVVFAARASTRRMLVASAVFAPIAMRVYYRER